MIFKTESADISEYIQDTNEDSLFEVKDVDSDVDVKINTVEPVFIETSNTEIKKEEITEEDPLSDTITKKEIDTELMMFKKEPEDEDCDLETKI